MIDAYLKENINEKNEKVYRHYAKLTTLDGNETEYITDKDCSAHRGKLVSVSFHSGKAVLSPVNTAATVSGRFDWSKKTLGKSVLASDIKILDIAVYENYRDGKYARIFPQRIDSLEIRQDNILYVEKNPKGEISGLVLKNATNDMYAFGMVVKVSNKSGGMLLMGEYDLLVGGEQKHINTSSVIYNVYSGQPALFDFEETELKGIKPLTELSERIKSIDDYFIYTSSAKYALSDKVVVYKKTSETENKYEVISLREAIAGKDKMTAYYDNPTQSGGKIRVLVIDL